LRQRGQRRWNHPVGGDYNTSYSYDLNGNIKTLTRNGTINDNGDFGSIDELIYAYNGNQLLTVNDVNDPQHQNNGFSDNGSFEQQEYNFDANGNLTSDLNKHINDIVYNFQNLPQKIALITEDNNNEINYLYDATGNKLAKLTTTNHAIVTTTDYINNFVFENKELKYILTAEGRIVPNRTGGYDYQYFLKDHLGSTRVMFDQDGDILQADNYYPFGMCMDGFNGYPNGDNPNKYLYNGKELQDDFGLDWYDYGARFYDAGLGRFHTVDPLSEKYSFQSPFVYGANNPVRFIDYMGMSVGEPDEDITKVLNSINKKQGYQVTANEKSTTVSKTEVTYDKDKISDRSNLNLIMTESIYNFDADGNISIVSITKSNISASFEESETYGKTGDLREVSTDILETQFFGLKYDSDKIDKLSKADPVVNGVSALLNSNNKSTLFKGDPSLPGLSTVDRAEKIIDYAANIIGSTLGLSTNIDNQTKLSIPISLGGNANSKLKKIARRKLYYK